MLHNYTLLLYFNRVRLASPPLPEMFKVEFEQYLAGDTVVAEEKEEEKEDSTSEAVIASH